MIKKNGITVIQGVVIFIIGLFLLIPLLMVFPNLFMSAQLNTGSSLLLLSSIFIVLYMLFSPKKVKPLKRDVMSDIDSAIKSKKDFVIFFSYKNYPVSEKQKKELSSMFNERDIPFYPLYRPIDPLETEMPTILAGKIPMKSGYIVITEGEIDGEYYTFDIEFQEEEKATTTSKIFKKISVGYPIVLIIFAVTLFTTFPIAVAYNIFILLLSIFISYTMLLEAENGAMKSYVVGNTTILYVVAALVGNVLIWLFSS